MCGYIYMYTHIHIYIPIYIHIYMYMCLALPSYVVCSTCPTWSTQRLTVV